MRKFPSFHTLLFQVHQSSSSIRDVLSNKMVHIISQANTDSLTLTNRIELLNMSSEDSIKIGNHTTAPHIHSSSELNVNSSISQSFVSH